MLLSPKLGRSPRFSMPNLESIVLKKLNQIIEANLDNPGFSLDDTCHELGISRSQLHRVLVEETQLSATLYIRKKRIEKAMTLLSTTQLRISEIADAVGIGSPANFSKYFLEEFNVSPSDFRKRVAVKVSSAQAPVTDVSIAVLPFVNMSNDPEQAYFSDGITEEITNALAQMPSLKVAGRTSCFTFKNNNQDLRQIGSLLNVNHILEGSVRKSGSKLRITAQLVSAADGYRVWSEKYDRDIADVFDIQDEIALAILKEIKISLFGKEKVLKRYTNNSEAYQLYLQGRYYYNKFAGVEEYQKALGYYEAALAIEPHYALAYSGIASCYLNLWFYRHLKPEDSLSHLKAATARAIEIDADVAESYLAQARIQLFYEWDLKSAEASFKKALTLSENSAELHIQYALLCGLKENHDLAKKHAQMALLIDPFLPLNNFYASYILWLAGNFEEAVLQGKKIIDMEPDFWSGYFILGLNLLQSKKYDEAHNALKTALKYNYSGLTISAFGVYYGLTRQYEEARKILDEMQLMNQTKPVSNYDIGIVYALIGETDQAFLHFEKSVENHEASMLFFKFILRDWLSDLKSDARCQGLLRKIYK